MSPCHPCLVQEEKNSESCYSGDAQSGPGGDGKASPWKSTPFPVVFPAGSK